MAPRLRSKGTQHKVPSAPPAGSEAAFLRSVKASLENFLEGRKLVAVKIRQVEGNNMDGILKVEGVKGDLQMVDFRATTAPQGGLSYLEVGGKRISHRLVSDAKRTR